MRAIGAGLRRVLPALGRDAAAIGGVLAIIHGMGMIYPPLAWIVAGTMMIAMAWLAALARK